MLRELNTAAKPECTAPEDLCLTCGLCCNGVLFADVKLQPKDNADKLRGLGLELVPLPGRSPARQGGASTVKLPQPCAAHDGCRCSIYPDRPSYCREFECLLLKSVKGGKTSMTQAAEIIQTALRRAGKVRKLLEALGDSDSHLPLARRFRRMTRRLQTEKLDETMAELYGELTLAVHDLNLLLSGAFFPGQS